MTEAINKLNTELRTKAKNDLKKGLFKLMNNSVFGKTMENVINHRDLKFVTTEKRSYLLLERNYHTSKSFLENILVIEMRPLNIRN